MTGDRLRRALPPVREMGLRKDLWPAMRRRLQERRRRVAWLDWALAGVVAAWLAAFPDAIGGLLWQL